MGRRYRYFYGKEGRDNFMGKELEITLWEGSRDIFMAFLRLRSMIAGIKNNILFTIFLGIVSFE